jgi:CMP-N,N'-diacetyllegionaminic acid synthase
MNLGIIPARAGSKGIKNKNMAPLGGRPLIDWTLQAATEARSIDHIIVTTNSPEIMGHVTEMWKHHDDHWLKPLEAYWRPDDLAQDDSPTEDAIGHVLHQWAEKRGETVDNVVLLQPTSPLRTAGHIDEALDHFESRRYSSMLSVVPSHAFLWRDCGVPIAHQPRFRPMRQEMDQYEENGAIYITDMEVWRKHHNRLGDSSGLYVMDEEQRLQIDTPFDLKMAEAILSWKSVPVS